MIIPGIRDSVANNLSFNGTIRLDIAFNISVLPEKNVLIYNIAINNNRPIAINITRGLACADPFAPIIQPGARTKSSMALDFK